jgi:hypothetical protein
LFVPRAGWRGSTLLLVAAALTPLIVHLLPWSGPRPLGVYLLPVFWVTFVAVYFRGAGFGLLVGLVTPLINLMMTGLPVPAGIGAMSLEVVFFVLAVAVFADRWPGLLFTAPLAWLAAKGLAVGVLHFIPGYAVGEPGLAHWLHSAQNGLAGLAALTLINVLLVRLHPPADAWEKE